MQAGHAKLDKAKLSKAKLDKAKLGKQKLREATYSKGKSIRKRNPEYQFEKQTWKINPEEIVER